MRSIEDEVREEVEHRRYQRNEAARKDFEEAVGLPDKPFEPEDDESERDQFIRFLSTDD